jgi:hypothetical protein
MSELLRVQVSGPLSVFAAGFGEELLAGGYRPGTVAKQLQLMAHLSRWMAAHNIAPAALGRVEIEFGQERRASHVQLASAHALEALLGYLRSLCVVPAAGSRQAPTAAGELLDRYADYLVVRRGLKPSTVRDYCNHVRVFLADRERVAGDLALGALDVAAINDFVLRESQRVSVSSMQAVAVAVRSVLRFLQVAAGIAGQGGRRVVRRAARGELRSAHIDRAAGLRDPDAAVAAGVARRRGRRASARGPGLARRRGDDQRQGQPPPATATAGRRRRGDRRLAAARPARLPQPIRVHPEHERRTIACIPRRSTAL